MRGTAWPQLVNAREEEGRYVFEASLPGVAL
jgi:hypothetical protein